MEIYKYRKHKMEKSELIENYTRFVNLVENTKDSIYYYQVYPTEKFLYLSPSTDNVLGEGSVEDGYINPDVCYANVHPDDYEIFRKKVMGEIDYSKSIVQRWKDKEGKYRWFEEYATPIYKNGVLVAIKRFLTFHLEEKRGYKAWGMEEQALGGRVWNVKILSIGYLKVTYQYNIRHIEIY